MVNKFCLSQDIRSFIEIRISYMHAIFPELSIHPLRRIRRFECDILFSDKHLPMCKFIVLLFLTDVVTFFFKTFAVLFIRKKTVPLSSNS